MLNRGDLVPHFTVTGARGERIAYADIWQRKALVLLSVTPDEASARPARAARAADLLEHDAAVVVTADAIPGVPRPGLLIADRWGEIAHVAQAARAEDLPDAGEILEWVRFVQRQCPECEGEAR